MPTHPTTHMPLHYSTRRQRDRARGTRTQRGYSNRWLRVAARYLQEHPMCVCERCKGKRLPATEVDHIVAVTGPADPLFWEPTNWQALSKPCHTRKTNEYDGGLGHVRRR